MPLAQQFSDQVRLLVAVLPHVARHECFAIKGGTALNLFVRDLPRLSVDIDLAYLPIADRDASLAAIDAALTMIAADIERLVPSARVTASVLEGTNYRIKLLAVRRGTTVKIEVTPVLRGSVFDPETREITRRAQEMFGFVQARTLSFEDLYGGKLCAALDRQHPRDLFDVRWLLDHEGITPRVKDAFLVYLLSHGRPIAELLAPIRRDIVALYEGEFSGMTLDPVPLELLLKTREEMIAKLHVQLTDADRDFLLAFKRGDPDWSGFQISHAQQLPAIRWKVHNLGRMKADKRASAVEALGKILGRERRGQTTAK
jgi:predicted nucleotidyltransferase component of viral defense system